MTEPEQGHLQKRQPLATCPAFYQPGRCLAFFQTQRCLLLFLLPMCVICALFSSAPLWGQEAREEAGREEVRGLSAEVRVEIVSSYIFRGQDIFAERLALQDKRYYEPHTASPALQPGLTFYASQLNLYFDIWLSFALANRVDSNPDSQGAAKPHVVSTHREKNNGLEYHDEVDYTLGYREEGGIGAIDFGLILYSYIDTDREVPERKEIFFSYSPPGDLSQYFFLGGFISPLYLSIYSSFDQQEEFAEENGGSYTYIQLGYDYEFRFSNGLGLYFDISVGFENNTSFDASAIRDHSGAIGARLSGFDLAYHFSIRGNSRFFDQDGNVDDFSVEDPRTDQLIELPRSLWWLSLGYRYRFGD